jgi:hypothetical protein
MHILKQPLLSMWFAAAVCTPSSTRAKKPTIAPQILRAEAPEDGPLVPVMFQVTRGLPKLKTEMARTIGHADGEKYRWGYMNADGKLVIEPAFSHAWPFSDGVAIVQVAERRETESRVGVYTSIGGIDRQGQLIIEPVFGQIEPFSDGLARARLPPPAFAMPGPTGFIDKTGQLVVALDIGKELDSAGDFSNERAWFRPYFSLAEAKAWLSDETIALFMKWSKDPNQTVRSSSSPAGFIDKTGTLVIEARFQDVGMFVDGLAKAIVDEATGYGFIDTTGAWVIAPQFKWAGSFSDGRAAVRQGDECGYIDRSGAVIIPVGFDACRRFSEGVAWVKSDEKWTLIAPDGTPSTLLREPPDGPLRDIRDRTHGWIGYQLDDETRTWVIHNEQGERVPLGGHTVEWYEPHPGGLVWVELNKAGFEHETQDQFYGFGAMAGYVDGTGRWVFGPTWGPWRSW